MLKWLGLDLLQKATLRFKESVTGKKRGFAKIRDIILGVPIIRRIIFWGLCWGPHILANYQNRNHSFFRVKGSECGELSRQVHHR